MALPFLMPQKNSKARGAVVSFAAVIRVVTRHATLSGEVRGATSDDLITAAKETRGAGYSLEFLAGMCHAVLQILTLFQTKTMAFFTPVFRHGL